MAGLCWMAVMLVFFLSAENGLAVVDQNRLAKIVNGILRVYSPGKGMFSLAVSIPDDQNQDIDHILDQVFRSDPGNNVKNKINNNEVYIGSRVVAAKVLGTDHAESRVVDHLAKLSRNKNDLLLFYVYASPCVEKCSSAKHRESIIKRIKGICKWDNYALVFTKIFKSNNGHTNSVEERSEALQLIGTSIGLNNIFRCDGTYKNTECTSCANGTKVAHCCVPDQQPG